MNFLIEQNTNSSTIILKPKFKSYFILVFTTLILLGFLLVLFQSIYGIIMGTFNLIFVPFFVMFFGLAYYNFFNIYWALIGDEKIVINDKFITITKIVTILKHSKKYKKHKISNIELVDTADKFGAVGTAMIGFSNNHVMFKYGRRKKMIGKQIEKEEGEKIIAELKNWGYTNE